VAKYYTEQSMQALRTAFESAVMSWPQVRAKKMFGCPCYQAGGKLFAFLVNGGLVLTHLPASDRGLLEEKFTPAVFQANQKAVPGWPQAPFVNKGDLTALLPFIRASYQSALEDAGS